MTPDFLAMNPNHAVPVLATPNGAFLSESNAILKYILENNEDWYPRSDLQKRAQVDAWLDYTIGDFRIPGAMSYVIAFLGYVFGLPAPTPEDTEFKKE